MSFHGIDKWLPILVCLAACCSSSTLAQDSKQDEKRKPIKLEKKIEPKLREIEWVGKAKSLLPEKGSGKWEQTDFGGGGDVQIKKGVLTIEFGERLAGMHLPVKDLPKNNYELTLEARRTEGIDFFCGLTFPVNDSHCCLIVGGWAGAVVGLSNIDDEDASSNATRQLIGFEDNQWYKIRIRVLQDQILVWIDDQCVVDQNINGKKIALRGDTLSCRPLGLCTFQTTSETRKLMIRKFKLKAKQQKKKSIEK